MESGRVALIRYTAPDGTACVGSGLLIDERRVLTADHVADGSGHRVECRSGTWQVGEVLRSGTLEVDLAVLSLSEPVAGLGRLGCARVDRSRVERVSWCVAVGFPRWRKDGDLRLAAQVEGWVPTAEGLASTADSGLRAGWLTLVGDRIPGAPEIPVGALSETAPSPWGGMSGAAVVADDLVIGVVRSHNLAAGGQSLTVTPLTAIGQLSPDLQHAFWNALGVANPSLLPALPGAISQVSHRDSGVTPTSNDNPIRINEYLKAARIRAQEHPYTVGSVRLPDLPSIYLRQKVNPQSGQLSDDPVPRPRGPVQMRISEVHVTERQRRVLLMRAADQTATHIAETLQRFDVRDVLRQYRGALLVGGPGTGKSSLLRHLLYESSAGWSFVRDQQFVPVLVQARTLPVGLPLPEALARAVVDDIGGFLDRSDLTDLFAVEPAPGIPWMILLDGMDEVLDYKDRKRLLDTIAYRWEDPQYRFLVTSRTLSPFELYPLERVNVPVFEIQQFSEDELPHFAERWFRAFGASDAPNLSSRLISQLEHNRLVQLACNPLIMTMACAIIASGSEGALPHSRADLYEKFVTLLMSKAADQLHELRRLQDRLTSYGRQSQDAIEELLADKRHLIERLASDRMGTPVQESLISHAEALASLMRPENVPVPAWHGIIEEVLRQSGVVVERGDDFAFVHQTIIEYLAACQSASQELSRREAWRLRLAAGRGDSRALFTASIMHGKGASLIGKTPRILSIRRLVHARLVASLAYEGLELPDKTVDVAREQLADFAALRRNCIPFIVREYVWDDYEDDCVLAAKSLMLLDKGGGLIALAHAAVDPSVGGFNIYSYNQMLGLDREQGMVILARLASSSEMESSDRVAVARLILGENRELGLEVIEAVALDRAVEGVFRSEMGFEMLGVDRSRGVRVLARLVADPLMEQYRIECEARLAGVDPGQCADAMAALIARVEAKLLDRFNTVARLMSLDSNMALKALEELSADPRNSGFVRTRAAVVLSEQSPFVGARALSDLARDEREGGFYRVFCLEWAWRASGKRERLADLEALASDGSLPGRWRVFAAEQLAAINRELGLVALGKIRGDVSAGHLWRLRAWAGEIVINREPARWS